MSDAVLLALIAQVGTLLSVLIAAFFGARKLNKVHDLVNGQSTAQMEKIERQTALIQALLGGQTVKRADDPALGVGIVRPPFKKGG